MNALFQYYFHDITRRYLKLFQDDQPFEILGVSCPLRCDTIDIKHKIPQEISPQILSIYIYLYITININFFTLS